VLRDQIGVDPALRRQTDVLVRYRTFARGDDPETPILAEREKPMIAMPMRAGLRRQRRVTLDVVGVQNVAQSWRGIRSRRC